MPGTKVGAQWTAPKPLHRNYAAFGNPSSLTLAPDEIINMIFAKDNAAIGGFNRWTINDVAYPSGQVQAKPMFHLKAGKRYRCACEMPVTIFIQFTFIATRLN
jgi:hypothetical protein